MKLKFLAAFFLSNFIVNHANSITEDSKILYDFTKMIISTSGTFSVTDKEGGHVSEVKARKNALKNFDDYIKNSCSDLEKNKFGTKTQWEESFHSKGSEIFPNGIVKVVLFAPYRDVFKIPAKKKVLKTDDGKKIAFLIPFSVPGTAIKCGTFSVDLGNNKKLILFPSDSVIDPVGLSVVKLSYDGKSDLKPASAEDANILNNSSITKEQNASALVYPITIVTPE